MAWIASKKKDGPLYLCDKFQVMKDGKLVWRTWRESLKVRELTADKKKQIISTYELDRLNKKRGLSKIDGEDEIGGSDWDAFAARYIREVKRGRLTRIKEIVVMKHFKRLVNPISLDSLERENGEAYVSKRFADGVMASTINTEVSYLSSIFKWAIIWKYIKSNPFFQVKAPDPAGKNSNTLPKWWDAEQIGMIMRRAGEIYGDIFETIIYLLFYQGLRINELRNVKKEWFNFRTKKMLVFGKGGTEKWIDAHPQVMERVRKMIKPGETGFLFLWPDGHQYYERTIQKRLKKILKSLVDEGKMPAFWLLPRVGTPHKFRHSMVTHLLANGASLEYVRDQARHENISTTNEYTHVIPKQNPEIEKLVINIPAASAT